MGKIEAKLTDGCDYTGESWRKKTAIDRAESVRNILGNECLWLLLTWSNSPTPMPKTTPRIGRFFSLQQGRVGQYLSPRVLIIRHPFRRIADIHVLGFDERQQAAKFAGYLAYRNLTFELKQNGWTSHPYEIRITKQSTLTRSLLQTLAYNDRHTDRKTTHPTHHQV